MSVIRRKLDEANTLHYFSVEQFVDDVLLMFRNCATFNYVSSFCGTRNAVKRSFWCLIGVLLPCSRTQRWARPVRAWRSSS